MSRRRANRVRHLCISDGMWMCSMPAALTPTILATQCSSLLELTIDAAKVGLIGDGISILAALTRLTCLSVR